MSLSQEIVDEINILMQFRSVTTLDGIKVHSTAPQSTREAAKRLYAKGLITQADGGYLTFAGIETAEHAQLLYNMLTLGDAGRSQPETAN
ncbi:MAG: TIGR02647 family protein [Proteobacteria bacterium]|nr:MAG: TIGR02647 family protein [Pseudomonadota bacterium]PIE40158.1 MAG: TIGR02647 family protein [Gammaproteobacteria bacterium]